MIYPDFIKKGSTIGVTACSDGKIDELDQQRLNFAAVQFQKRGYHVIETPDVRTSSFGRSADAVCRVAELYQLLEQKEVCAVIQASGGDYLSEILPLLDYQKFLDHPKWLQGYSDPTGLLYTVTVTTELATIYGSNYSDFGMEEWHPSLEQQLKLLEGTLGKQTSYPAYMNGYLERKTGLEGYVTDCEVQWKALTDGKQQITGKECFNRKLTLSGRLLGGCLDVLLNLSGTRFDQTKKFCSKYGDAGILWYLESFHLNSEQLYLGLFQLRESGWFENASGFWFGRPAFYESDYGISYEDAVYHALKELHVPILLDADFGHKPPRMPIVNGAFGTVVFENGTGSLEQEFC